MLGLDKRLIHKTTQKWITLGMVAGLMDVALTLALFYLLGLVLNKALVGENLLAEVLPAVVLLFVLKFSFAWLFRTAQSKASAETKVSVRDMVYRHALKLGPGLLGKGRTGQLVNTTVDGMDWLENYYGVYFIQFAVGMGTPVLLCLFILGIDWVVGPGPYRQHTHHASLYKSRIRHVYGREPALLPGIGQPKRSIPRFHSRHVDVEVIQPESPNAARRCAQPTKNFARKR